MPAVHQKKTENEFKTLKKHIFTFSMHAKNEVTAAI